MGRMTWGKASVTARFALVVAAGFAASPAAAQTVLPGPAQPGLLERRFEQPELPKAGGGEIVTPEKEGAVAPAGAEDATFILKGVVIEGATAFPESDFLPLYEKLLGTTVSVKTVYDIAQAITTKYTAAGYVLSQAVVPPQKINGNGFARIKVIEGYVDKVIIQGDIKGPRSLLEEYGDKIRASRPLKLDVLERYLLLASDLPGASASGTLKPSDTTPGAADLVFEVTHKSLDAFSSFDNRGSKYVGPWQLATGANLNSVLGLYERTSLQLATTPFNVGELKYGKIAHEETVGEEGTKISADAGYADSHPGWTLKPNALRSHSLTVGLGVSHPLVRSRAENLTLRSRVEVTAGNQGLTVTTSANVAFGGAVGVTAPLAYLTVTSANVALGGDVKTAGNQAYTGRVVLNANDTLTSSLGGSTGNVSFSTYVDAASSGVQSLTIAAGAGNVGFGSGVGAIRSLAGLSVTGGKILLSSDITTTGNQTYAGAVVLNNDVTLYAANGYNMAFNSTVDSGSSAHKLKTIVNSGTTTFTGAVGGGNALSALELNAGNIYLGGNVTTTGEQDYTGAVILNNNVTMNSSAGNGLVYFIFASVNAATAGTQSLTVNAGTGDAKFLGGSVGATNSLSSLSVTGTNISLGSSVTTSGNQTYGGAVVLTAADTLTSSAGNGNVSFSSTLNSDGTARALTIAAGTGNVGFGGAVGGGNKLASLAVTGSAITLGGNVTTNANQTYTGNVILGATDTLDSSNSNGNITFSSAVEATTSGAQGLTVTAGTGNVTFGAAEGLIGNLSTLAVTGSTISLNGNVTTTGNQTYTGAVVLPIGSRMRSGSGNVAFSSTLDAGTSAGTQTLTVFGTGNVTFGGAVGGTNKFASLVATETNIRLGGNITTIGGQNYNGAVTLGTNATLDSSNGNGAIAFSSTLDAASAGTQGLTIAAGTGNVSFGGAVGGGNRLASTAVTGGNVTLGGNVSTVNDQNWQGNIILGGNATLSMTGTGFMTFQQTVDAASAGTQGLTVDAAASSGVFFKRAVGGTAALASLTSTTGTSVGVLYDVTTTGNQTYNGPLNLRVGNTHTLSSAGGNGNMLFGSTIDAATAGTQSLTLAAGTGNVTFGGAVGATNRLASLAVTGGKVTIGGNVTTKGNQTYTGPVVLSATDTLDSSNNNGNVAFSSTVDGATVSLQGLTVTSGTGNVTFGGIVGGIKALLSRTVNGATMSKGTGGIAVAPTTDTGTTASTSQTTNNVVNTISSIVGGSSSSSSGSTSQSPSASSGGGGTRLAFATDVFAKDYKLVSISPALSQQNPSSNSAGSSLFGGSGSGGNTAVAATGGNGGGGNTGGTGGANTGGEQGASGGNSGGNSGGEGDGRGEKKDDKRSR